MDPRVVEHARLLVSYSTRVKKDDNVLIQLSDDGRELATELFKEVARVGGNPLIVMAPSEAVRGYYELTPQEYLTSFPEHFFELVKASDVFISIRSDENPRFLSSVDPVKLKIRQTTLKKIQDVRLEKRWCLTQVPTSGYAQEAEMSLREYEDFLYSAILIDWESESKAMERLKEVLEDAEQLRIVGEKTDITMSIKGRKPVLSDGTHNLPGGEVFTAPLEDSVNGEIFFDLPAIAYGKEVQGVSLKFDEGKVVEYAAEKNQQLLATLLDTDEGAKQVGEIGIGTNRRIGKFTRNILFDEKIGGTIHLALGLAYKECGGVVESAIHWDMIKTMKPGKMFADGRLIQSDGQFTWE